MATRSAGGTGPDAVIGVYPSSSSSMEYLVQLAADGHVYCDCPGWRFQKGIPPKERSCKHIKLYQNQDYGILDEWYARQGA